MLKEGTLLCKENRPEMAEFFRKRSMPVIATKIPGSVKEVIIDISKQARQDFDGRRAQILKSKVQLLHSKTEIIKKQAISRDERFRNRMDTIGKNKQFKSRMKTWFTLMLALEVLNKLDQYRLGRSP